MSAVAEYQATVHASKTGDSALLVSTIDAAVGTGYGKPEVWTVRLNERLGLELLAQHFDYPQFPAPDGPEIFAQKSMATGEALLDVFARPVHDSVGFYANVGGFLDLHRELLPKVVSVTLEQSRRLTEGLLRHKLVRRLE